MNDLENPSEDDRVICVYHINPTRFGCNGCTPDPINNPNCPSYRPVTIHHFKMIEDGSMPEPTLRRLNPLSEKKDQDNPVSRMACESLKRDFYKETGGFYIQNDTRNK